MEIKRSSGVSVSTQNAAPEFLTAESPKTEIFREVHSTY